MKVYWFYECDYAHRWNIFRDEDAEAALGDDICPEGHKAVTLSRKSPVNKPILALVPAGFVDPAITDLTYHEHDYYVTIADMEGAHTLRSRSTYGFREALEFLKHFEDLAWNQALYLWQKLDT